MSSLSGPGFRQHKSHFLHSFQISPNCWTMSCTVQTENKTTWNDSLLCVRNWKSFENWRIDRPSKSCSQKYVGKVSFVEAMGWNDVTAYVEYKLWEPQRIYSVQNHELPVTRFHIKIGCYLAGSRIMTRVRFGLVLLSPRIEIANSIMSFVTVKCFQAKQGFYDSIYTFSFINRPRINLLPRLGTISTDSVVLTFSSVTSKRLGAAVHKKLREDFELRYVRVSSYCKSSQILTFIGLIHSVCDRQWVWAINFWHWYMSTARLGGTRSRADGNYEGAGRKLKWRRKEGSIQGFGQHSKSRACYQRGERRGKNLEAKGREPG